MRHATLYRKWRPRRMGEVVGQEPVVRTLARAIESCRAIINNSSLDVVEMDAASNRGIDEIRDLRDRVNLAPVAGRMKVYIIDEVHMLTPEAFNALLKMLEEPPEHVVFVLATTEMPRASWISSPPSPKRGSRRRWCANSSGASAPRRYWRLQPRCTNAGR